LHDPCPTPSLLLALVALSIVHRFRPAWLAVSIAEAACDGGEHSERLSRLCSRALGPFQAALDALGRRGRPPKPVTNDGELRLTRALLDVATRLLARVSLRRSVLRELVVGAWLRLRGEEPSLTQARFCEALALPDRTLRAWLARPMRPTPPVPPAPEPAPDKKRARGLRRPRFGFELVVPGTQLGADTTDTSAFGVPLKLVAAQDVGGRDERLFDSVIVDDRESAEHVVRVVTEALAGREGMQVITDQGTPYLAEATRAALEQLGAEHAPQREGDPLGKATTERAFGTLKGIAQSLLSITDRIAEAVPALRDAKLGTAAAHVVFTALLRAYQAGARATRAAIAARGPIDEEALVRAAARARDAARADEQSRRLLLRHLHEIYQFDMLPRAFERQFVRYPLAVLRDAETRLRPQLHRNDIRSLGRYFGAVVRNCFADYCADRTRRQRDAREHAAAAKDDRETAAVRQRRLSDPASWLREALDALASQWQPRDAVLLFGGVGLGLGWLRASLARLVALHGLLAATDTVTGALADLRLRRHDHLGHAGFEAVAALVRRELGRLGPQHRAPPNTQCPPPANSATLWNIGRTTRPPAPDPLRI
jgi:transposase InsO family protein